jgi:hypothetical protein
MSMQSDVLASVPLTSTGNFTNQATANVARCRVKGIYIVPTATAGSVVLKDGGSGGNTITTINTVASATQPTYLLFPDEGMLFRTDVHGTLTNVGSVTLYYA